MCDGEYGGTQRTLYTTDVAGPALTPERPDTTTGLKTPDFGTQPECGAHRLANMHRKWRPCPTVILLCSPFGEYSVKACQQVRRWTPCFHASPT